MTSLYERVGSLFAHVVEGVCASTRDEHTVLQMIYRVGDLRLNHVGKWPRLQARREL